MKHLKKKPDDWDDENGAFDPGWYLLVDYFDDIRYIGPYDTKAEVTEIKRGLTRVIKEMKKWDDQNTRTSTTTSESK